MELNILWHLLLSLVMIAVTYNFAADGFKALKSGGPGSAWSIVPFLFGTLFMAFFIYAAIKELHRANDCTNNNIPLTECMREET